MPLYFFLCFITAIGIVFLAVRYFIRRRTSLAMRLFTKAMEAENNGAYPEATVYYQNALAEIKKIRFHHYLKILIREKLKVLHTIVTYTRDQGFVRVNDSWIS